MPPVARADDALAYVGSRSITTTRPRNPSRLRCNAMLDPTTPPPTIATFIRASGEWRLAWSTAHQPPRTHVARTADDSLRWARGTRRPPHVHRTTRAHCSGDAFPHRSRDGPRADRSS